MTLHLFQIKKIVTFFAIILAVILMMIAINYLKTFSHFDPFARFKGAYSNPWGEGTGARMEDVVIRISEEKRQVASLHAKEVKIRRDRQFINLVGISDGIVYENDKPKANFSARLANYEATEEKLSVWGDVLVQAEGMRGKTAEVLFSAKNKSIEINQGLVGKYKDGDIKVQTLFFDLSKGIAHATNIEWKGPIETQEKGKPKTRQILIRGSRWESLRNPDREIYYDAEAVETDSIIRAPKIIWEKDKDIITAEGEVEYYGPDAIMSAPKLIVYRKEKRAVASGGVKLLIKPEKEKGKVEAPPLRPAQPNLPPGLQQPPTGQGLSKEEQRELDEELRTGKTVRKYPTVVTCEKVEYFYGDGGKRAILTGNPKARQEMRAGAWREITAPKAVYEEDKNLLTLVSESGGKDVRMKNSKGDDLVAETLEISTKEGDETIRGTHIEGKMIVDDDDEPPPRSEPPPARSGGGG